MIHEARYDGPPDGPPIKQLDSNKFMRPVMTGLLAGLL